MCCAGRSLSRLVLNQASVGADMPNPVSRARPAELAKALSYSLKGLRAAIEVEASFRLELCLFLLLAPVAIWIGDTGLERAVLIGSMMMIMVAELLNGSIEAIVDKTTPEFHELAGRSKDMGSAAVFLCMLNAGLVWAFILLD